MINNDYIITDLTDTSLRLIIAGDVFMQSVYSGTNDSNSSDDVTEAVSYN